MIQAMRAALTGRHDALCWSLGGFVHNTLPEVRALRCHLYFFVRFLVILCILFLMRLVGIRSEGIYE